MRKTSRGYTVLELLIACSIMFLALTFGLPGLQTLVNEEQSKSTANIFLASVVLARSEAVKRQQTVLVGARGTSWADGWDVFVDIDNDTTHGVTEPLLFSAESLPKGFHLSGNKPVAGFIRFRPSGQSKLPSGAFQAGTITLCHATIRSTQRELILSAMGRLRIRRTLNTSCSQ